jgi:hypothetical protein
MALSVVAALAHQVMTFEAIISHIGNKDLVLSGHVDIDS